MDIFPHIMDTKDGIAAKSKNSLMKKLALNRISTSVYHAKEKIWTKTALQAVILSTLISKVIAAEVEMTGFLKFEQWTGLSTSDNSIDNTLLIDPKYPTKPDLVTYTSSFNSRPVFPDDSHEGYGARMSGWITPPTTGDYRFFIYSDDSSRLFLSTDDKSANLMQIAEETGCCNAFAEPDVAGGRTSEPIRLLAGKKYYVEMIWKEGNGGDYAQVAWRKEGDITPAASLTPIPGWALSSLVDPTGAAVTLLEQPKSASVAENDTITFSVTANVSTPFKRYPSAGSVALQTLYQWYQNGQPIVGANSSTYTISAVKKAAHDQAKFKCLIAVPGVAQTSAEHSYS